MPKPPPSPPSGGRTTTPIAAHQRPTALEEVCVKTTDMAKKLGLPLDLPIRESQLKEATLSFWEGDLCGQLILTNGYRFHYGHGHATGFYAPDCASNVGFNEVLTNLPPVDTRKLYGKVRYTTQQVGEFATKLVRKLGYPDTAVFLDQPAFVYGGPSERSPQYTRFYVRWKPPWTKSIEDPGAQFTLAEVDGVSLELMSLGIRSTNLYRPSILKPDTKP